MEVIVIYALAIVVAYPLALAGVVIYTVSVVNRDVRRIQARWGAAHANEYAAQAQTALRGTMLRPAMFYGTMLAIAGCLLIRYLA